MYRYVLVALGAVSAPFVVEASVVISEVAWMGTAENANAEWIELYNDGPAEDVSGWTLSAVDGQPAIALSGTISANGYVLLERTNDDTVPGVSAFLIYTGAMGNTGEILELRDEGGALIDRVDGSGDWAIGGSNETKETLQRSGTPSTGSFITAPATPQGGGGVPSSTNDTSDDTATNTSGTVAGTNTSRSSSSGGNILYPSAKVREEKTPRLEPALTLVLPEERIVTVRVPTDYSVRAHKESGTEIMVTDVVWNFGDGTVEKGREVTHTYTYPGTYVVTVTGHRSGFLSEIQDTTRMVVKAVEPAVEIVSVTTEYIEIKNVSGDEVDLSGYVLMQGSAVFRLPPGTVLLAKTSVRFPRSRTGLSTGVATALYHPSGALAVSYGTLATQTVSVSSASRNITPPATVASAYDAREVIPEENRVLAQFEISTSSTSSEMSARTIDTAETGNQSEDALWLWLLGLGSAILATVVVVLLARREPQPEIIDGFEIESDE